MSLAEALSFNSEGAFVNIAVMKVNRAEFEAIFRKLLEQKPQKRESLKTGQTKKSRTIIPPKPQPER